MRARNDVGDLLVCQRLRGSYYLLSTAKSSCRLCHKYLSTSQWAKLTDSISADENENNVEVDVLIGADYYWHFLTSAVKRGESGPTALQTKVSRVLSGPVQGGSALNSTQVNFTNIHALRVDTHNQFMDESSEDRALERKLAEFWDLEAIGISPEEKSVYERFNEDITFKDGRYEVKLPWKVSRNSARQLHTLSKKTEISHAKTSIRRNQARVQCCHSRSA